MTTDAWSVWHEQGVVTMAKGTRMGVPLGVRMLPPLVTRRRSTVWDRMLSDRYFIAERMALVINWSSAKMSGFSLTSTVKLTVIFTGGDLLYCGALPLPDPWLEAVYD